jgi:hypothetical protein
VLAPVPAELTRKELPDQSPTKAKRDDTTKKLDMKSEAVFPPLPSPARKMDMEKKEQMPKKTTNYKEDTKKHILEDPLDY